MSRVVHEFTPIHKVLALVLPGQSPDASLAAALSIAPAQNVTLLGLVVMPPDEPLAFGMLAARELRSRLQRSGTSRSSQVRVKVRVTHDLWSEVTHLVQGEGFELMAVAYPSGPDAHAAEVLEGLARPPCDLAMVHGVPSQGGLRSVVVPVRGGPYAEVAIRLALTIGKAHGATVKVLHVRPAAGERVTTDEAEVAYEGLSGVLSKLPGVAREEVETDDPLGTILAAAQDASLLVMGSAARLRGPSLGPIADRVMRESPAPVMLVRSQRPVPVEPADPAMAEGAIALLVDKWLAENTYYADEFGDAEELLASKARSGMSISLVLPACNNEATIGKVIRALKPALYDKTPLLDEIVVVDEGSTDRTCEIAAGLGVPVYSQREILSQYGALSGKGEAFWKSLFLTRGDLIVWLDPDIANSGPQFVLGLLGPLLRERRCLYVGGYGRWKSDSDERSHSAVSHLSELVVRPLVNLLHPQLAGVLQPFSGACAARREALESLPFHAGRGVQPGLLIAMYQRYGLSSIAQVNLQEPLNRAGDPPSMETLAESAHAAFQVFIGDLERRHGLVLVDDINRTMKMVRRSPVPDRADAERLHLEVREVREHVRPPMIDIPEYVASRSESGEEVWT